MSVKTKADGAAADALVFEERIPDPEGTTARRSPDEVSTFKH